MITVVIDYKPLMKFLRPLEDIRKGVPRVLVPTINRSLAAGVTAIKREVRKNYEIKYKDIPVKKESASYENLEGKLIVADKMMELGKFFISPRKMQRGPTRRKLFARVKVGKGGQLATGFMTDGLPYAGPWRRVGRARLPIRKMLTISAPIMASQPSVEPVVVKVMGDTFAKRLEHEIERVLSQAGK